jgi:DNA-binding MarR family transcriptional regulator
MAAKRDEITRLRLVLSRLARRLRQEGSGGITPSQLSALAVIDRRGPLTLGELAAIEQVQPPSVSRIVGALEGEGLVEREVDDRDRRAVLVRVTPAAHDQLEAIRRERNAWLASRLATLDADERALVRAAVPVLERLLDPGSP